MELTIKILVFILIVVSAVIMFHGIGEAQNNKTKTRIEVSIKISTTNAVQTTNDKIEY